MKRDCGDGDLIPLYWEIHYHDGPKDKESKLKGLNQEEALTQYDELCKKLDHVEYSNARLYVYDKKGYANCMKSWSYANGQHKDRMEEL